MALPSTFPVGPQSRKRDRSVPSRHKKRRRRHLVERQSLRSTRWPEIRLLHPNPPMEQSISDRSVAYLLKKGALAESIPNILLEMFQHRFHRRPILVEVAEEDPSLQAGHDHPRTGSRVALGELAGLRASRDQLLKRADELCHRLARCGA